MSIGHSLLADFLLEIFAQRCDRLRLSLHEELDHFLQEDALEFLEPARFQRAAFDDDVAIAREERVVLRLVAEHGVELLVELDFDSRRQFLAPDRVAKFARHLLISSRWNEINAIGIDFDDLRALRLKPIDHLLQKIAPDLRHARGGIEVGKVSLRETEIAVEAVDQNLEGVLQSVEVTLLFRIFRAAHVGFRLQAESAQIGEQDAGRSGADRLPESNRTAA